MATQPHSHRPAVCESCGGSFEARTDSRGRFCSRPCSAQSRIGGKQNGLHFNRTLGRWIIRCRDGTQAYFYRAVAEAKLGRALGRNEIVHHIDGDSSNDDPGNLDVMSRADHVRLHQAAGTMTTWRG
jgi:hypothetical protein